MGTGVNVIGRLPFKVCQQEGVAGCVSALVQCSIQSWQTFHRGPPSS